MSPNKGGYFGIFYKSSDKVLTLDDKYSNPDLVKENDGAEDHQDKEKIERHAGSSIYFLLEKEDFSAWHRLNSDEIWHYYDGGSPIDIYIIDQNGCLTTQPLGNPLLSEGASFQVVIKAGDWFAAEVRDKSSFALMGCTVSPGFEYCDFTLADRNVLASQYPEYGTIINKLTRLNTVASDLLLMDATASSTSSSSSLTPTLKIQAQSSDMDNQQEMLNTDHAEDDSLFIKKNISSSTEILISGIGLYSRSNKPTEVIDAATLNITT